MRDRNVPPPKNRGILSILAGGTVLLFFTALAGPAGTTGPPNEDRLIAGLKEIHVEIKEMGPYPGDAFIRREFFVGQDDDDTNKDVHVTVLIQPFEDRERMTLRVTQMVREPAGSRTSVAVSSKALVCLVSGEGVEIQSSDYEKGALGRLVPDILTAIRNKKRLLKIG